MSTESLIAFLNARLDDAGAEARAALIAGSHPARALREIAAMRAIVRRCQARMNEMDVHPNGLVSPRALLARQVLMDLASIWSDHPDYPGRVETGVSTCDHRWLRLPIADSFAIYRCKECEKALQFSWIAAAGGTLDDLDRAFEAKYGGKVIVAALAEADPLHGARAIMKQQALDAGQPITERWHDHPSPDFCGPRCPGGGTGWDGKGLVIDHFAEP